ncbi:zinc finger protein 484 isoform X1 [Hydra vulgaris]|uniref:Zinc finger protein 484 isoform X1 n=1 Tax=Hydra vulgaris TaxID=6087 RepID=A0ABM4CN73_HYDVU
MLAAPKGMVAVAKDEDNDIISIMAADPKLKNTSGQVMIYESGSVVMKVEVGTTLEVLKLLYESEQSQPCDKIIGVRPRKSNGIPCIITLQESKLEENSYDVIFRDKKQNKPKELVTNDLAAGEKQDTTRCVDCSREAWKSKRYTSIGMNTEISINPLSEIDSVRSHLLSSSKHQTNIEASYHNRSRARPPIHRPTPLEPNHYSLHKTEYIVSTLPPIPTNVSVPDFIKYHPRSPRRSPVYGNGHTQICFPSQNAIKRPDLDSISFEPIAHYRIPRSHSPHVVNRSGTVSPRPRSRSPLDNKREVQDETKHDEQRSLYESIYMRKTDHYPHYEQKQHTNLGTTSSNQPDETVEREPPVFVLPNDFDSNLDRIDEHVINYQAPKSFNSVESEKEDSKASVGCTSPVTSIGSDSGHSIIDEQLPSTRNLSCKICKKVFPTKSTLYKHLRGHPSDEKPFKCSECGQGFTLSSNLRQHRIIHRGYKPFQCEYCGKKFMRSNVYKQHRRIHTGEQMHKCSLCPSEFLQRYALVKHMKKSHNIESIET